VTRPSFATAVAALRARDPRFPWVQPTEHEADAADALEVTELLHQPNRPEPDTAGDWGTCTGCGLSWPCPVWVDHEQLAVQWLGRAADRVNTHATSSRRAAA
jgi:hypothetical protein